MATRSSSASTFSSSALPDSIVSFSACDRLHLLGRVLAPLLRLADLLGERLALGLRALDPRQQLAAAGVEGEQLVDLLGGAAARERRLDPLGVGADQLQVEHGSERLGRGLAGARRGFGFFAGVLGDEAGDGFGFVADDDVLGHDRAGETAVLDREESVFICLGSLVEVRPLRAQAAIAACPGCRRR